MSAPNLLERATDLRSVPSAAAIQAIMDVTPASEVADKIGELIRARRNGEPDTRAVEVGLKLWLSYVIGLPVQRQHVINEKLVTAKPTKAMLANPETRAMLRRLLDDADKGKAGDVEVE
jgi:hypothetical protein